MSFCAYFDIDLPRALREQLVEALSRIDTGDLSSANLAQVPTERGVYQLYHKAELVYVGKASRLRARLTKHLKKIQGRKNISLSEMSFKCLWMSPNWITLAPEAQLIALYRSQGTAIWNGNGFGPNDPGAGREDRNQPPAMFDEQYPIRDDWQCDFIAPGRSDALSILRSMKKNLPYLLRFQKSSPDYETELQIPQAGIGACDLLRLIAAALPQGWQATRFPSHLILYKKLREFNYGTILYPAQ